jgi:hypothetical protein
MDNSLTELRTLAISQGEALAETLAKIRELTPPEEVVDVEGAVLKMAAHDTKGYKTEWKKIIERGMVDNVERILEECHEYFCSDFECDSVINQSLLTLGPSSGAKWKKFCVRVIQYLKVNGSFGTPEEGLDDFEDTAGGCDEITQDAAIYLLEHPEWTPTPVA